ncbi:MAG TPA: hypothetical protein PKC72_08870 [Chitinophagaceae bacterium]|nr:hypothetical protein [Chitinophagaceae bacterium]
MLQSLIKTLARKGYTTNTRPFELNIVGVRSTNHKANQFDDTINIFYKRMDGEWIYNSFPATTDPGTYWLKTFMNPGGTAILKPGQYKNSHRVGVHRGKYQALVQQNPVTVYRDTNKDDHLDCKAGTEQTGIFGINIHRASVNGVTKEVNKHSAGCQVLANIDDFNLLIKLAYRHKQLYGNNFTYTLIGEGEIG